MFSGVHTSTLTIMNQSQCLQKVESNQQSLRGVLLFFFLNIIYVIVLNTTKLEIAQAWREKYYVKR